MCVRVIPLSHQLSIFNLMLFFNIISLTFKLFICFLGIQYFHFNWHFKYFCLLLFNSHSALSNNILIHWRSEVLTCNVGFFKSSLFLRFTLQLVTYLNVLATLCLTFNISGSDWWSESGKNNHQIKNRGKSNTDRNKAWQIRRELKRQNKAGNRLNLKLKADRQRIKVTFLLLTLTFSELVTNVTSEVSFAKSLPRIIWIRDILMSCWC